MKPLKAAAIVAGAMVAAGAVTPSAAHEGKEDDADSLAGAVKQVTGGPDTVQQHLRTIATQGDESEPNVLEGPGHTVTQRTGGTLLGGLAVRR